MVSTLLVTPLAEMRNVFFAVGLLHAPDDAGRETRSSGKAIHHELCLHIVIRRLRCWNLAPGDAAVLILGTREAVARRPYCPNSLEQSAFEALGPVEAVVLKRGV